MLELYLLPDLIELVYAYLYVSELEALQVNITSRHLYTRLVSYLDTGDIASINPKLRHIRFVDYLMTSILYTRTTSAVDFTMMHSYPLTLRRHILKYNSLDYVRCFEFVFTELVTHGVDILSGLTWTNLNDVSQMVVADVLILANDYETLVKLNPDPDSVLIFFNLKITDGDDAAAMDLLLHFKISVVHLCYRIRAVVKNKMERCVTLLREFRSQYNNWDHIYTVYGITDILRGALEDEHKTLIELLIDRGNVDPYGDYVKLCTAHHVDTTTFEKLVSLLEWTRADFDRELSWCNRNNPNYAEILTTFNQNNDIPNSEPRLGSGFTAFITQHV